MNKREKNIRKIFNEVQKIPYSIRWNNCYVKSKLLLTRLKKYKIYWKLYALKYFLNTGIDEQKYIPWEYDIHYFVWIWLNNKIIFLDVAYDKWLDGLFYVQNYISQQWTKLSYEPIWGCIYLKRTTKFKKIFRAFEEDIEKAYNKYPKQFESFTNKYEEIITKYRENN